MSESNLLIRAPSWQLLLGTCSRFVRNHARLTLAITAGFIFCHYLEPQLIAFDQWYELDEVDQYRWYASVFLSLVWTVVLAFAALRFFCLENGLLLQVESSNLIRFILAYASIHIAVILGTVIFLVPGMLIWICTLMFPLLILVRGKTIGESFAISYRALQGQIWPITFQFLPFVAIVAGLYIVFYLLSESMLFWPALPLLEVALFLFSAIISSYYSVTLYCNLCGQHDS
ncbi:MAG: hypothetical protein AAF542_23785 [Pseudomonadota bacterium]